jgi:hypothetical protein
MPTAIVNHDDEQRVEMGRQNLAAAQQYIDAMANVVSAMEGGRAHGPNLQPE